MGFQTLVRLPSSTTVSQHWPRSGPGQHWICRYWVGCLHQPHQSLSCALWALLPPPRPTPDEGTFVQGYPPYGALCLSHDTRLTVPLSPRYSGRFRQIGLQCQNTSHGSSPASTRQGCPAQWRPRAFWASSVLHSTDYTRGTPSHPLIPTMPTEYRVPPSAPQRLETAHCRCSGIWPECGTTPASLASSSPPQLLAPAGSASYSDLTLAKKKRTSVVKTLVNPVGVSESRSLDLAQALLSGRDSILLLHLTAD